MDEIKKSPQGGGQPEHTAQPWIGPTKESPYFVGHTPKLSMQSPQNAWGGLINPPESQKNLWIHTITFTNFSAYPLVVQIWHNAEAIGQVCNSPFVSALDDAQAHFPSPKAKLLYAQQVKTVPAQGTSVFSRVIPPFCTAIGKYAGKIILPPSGSLLVFVSTMEKHSAQMEIAFGWRESYLI